jgi:hypothetical protein
MGTCSAWQRPAVLSRAPPRGSKRAFAGLPGDAVRKSDLLDAARSADLDRPTKNSGGGSGGHRPARRNAAPGAIPFTGSTLRLVVGWQALTRVCECVGQRFRSGPLPGSVPVTRRDSTRIWPLRRAVPRTCPSWLPAPAWLTGWLDEKHVRVGGRVGPPHCCGGPPSEPCVLLVVAHGSSKPRRRRGRR